MMYSYHSLPELQESILENENESKKIPQIRDFICYKDTKYIFYIFFLIILILFLIFIIIILSRI
jgi:hypothetical protein